MNNPYDIVAAFEQAVADYAGAPYGVAVDSCTNALMLSLVYKKRSDCYMPPVRLPTYTYVGVVQVVLNAGYKIDFLNFEWSGAYYLNPYLIIDSARRFRRGMYRANTLYCLSFHEGKHLPIGTGGMILTDDEEAADTLRKMRYDGRTSGVPPAEDTFITPGYHCHMKPNEAARGLMLMRYIADDNPDLPWDGYADLSKQEAFR